MRILKYFLHLLIKVKKSAKGRKKEYHKRVSPIVRSGGRSSVTHIAMMKAKKIARPMEVATMVVRVLPFHAAIAPSAQCAIATNAKTAK